MLKKYDSSEFIPRKIQLKVIKLLLFIFRISNYLSISLQLLKSKGILQSKYFFKFIENQFERFSMMKARDLLNFFPFLLLIYKISQHECTEPQLKISVKMLKINFY